MASKYKNEVSSIYPEFINKESYDIWSNTF